MSLLHSPAHLPPSSALHLSQQAPLVLKQSTRSSFLNLPLLPKYESPELWTTQEHLFLNCLRTRDDKSAKLCLDRLTERFGAENERVMALQGLYDEALADSDAELRRILVNYEKALEKDPSNMPIAKRRVALLRSLSKTAEAIDALTRLADVSPTDAEIWMELSDLYLAQALYPQAIYCLEEALLIVPNAWNLHARLGEIVFMSAASTGNASESSVKAHLTSIKRFCRSIELCEDYPRGYYGLYLATSRLLEKSYKPPQGDDDDDEDPTSLEAIKRLNTLAKDKLKEIVKSSASGKADYDKAEMIAIQELLNRG